MKTAQVPTLGTTLVESSWQEQAARVYCLWMDNLSSANIAVQQVEESDYTALSTDLDAFVAYTTSWLSTNIAASSEGGEVTAFDKSYLPELALFIGLVASGQWGGVFILFVKVGIAFLLDMFSENLSPDATTGETAEMLKKIFAVLDESGNVVGNRLEGLANLQIAINNIVSQGELDSLFSASE